MNDEIKTAYGKINTLSGEINGETNTVYGEIKLSINCSANTHEVK